MVNTKINIPLLFLISLFATIRGQNMNQTEIATVGGGCFWCIEAVYQRIDGILSVTPGYAGGESKTTTYKEVCTGKTGHAEVAKIEFDTDIISYEQILNIFWQAHDPTTLNRQGADVGTQYRSVIYFHNESQETIAREVIVELRDYFENPIVTEISKAEIFYEAEEVHQNYYRENTAQGYCSFVIKPKLAKLRKLHLSKLKDKTI